MWVQTERDRATAPPHYTTVQYTAGSDFIHVIPQQQHFNQQYRIRLIFIIKIVFTQRCVTINNNNNPIKKLHSVLKSQNLEKNKNHKHTGSVCLKQNTAAA